MNADRRIVPSHHVSSVLAEDHMTERAVEMKEKLQSSPNVLHKVAHKWTSYNGLNPLSRVILKHAPKIPEAPKKHHTHSPATHAINKHSGHEAHHGHDAHGHGHEAHHGHDAHGHGHEAHHGHDAHGHGHEAHHGHDAHGHGHEAHHGHDAHGHGHEAHHGHDAHGHGHEAHHGHGESLVRNYCETGFGMLGRLIGTLLDYTLKLAAILLLFGPTRTAILIALLVGLINQFSGTKMPTELLVGLGFVVHLIFSGASKLAHSNGEHGGGGHGHGHGGHDHGGGHGHDDHGHGHH